MSGRMPDRCLSVVNSPRCHIPPRVSCPSTANSDGTQAVCNSSRHCHWHIISGSKTNFTSHAPHLYPFFFHWRSDVYEWRSGEHITGPQRTLTRTLSRCFHSSAHSRSVRRWSITSSCRAPCTAKEEHTHRSMWDILEHTALQTHSSTVLSSVSILMTSDNTL